MAAFGDLPGWAIPVLLLSLCILCFCVVGCCCRGKKTKSKPDRTRQLQLEPTPLAAQSREREIRTFTPPTEPVAAQELIPTVQTTHLSAPAVPPAGRKYIGWFSHPMFGMTPTQVEVTQTISSDGWPTGSWTIWGQTQVVIVVDDGVQVLIEDDRTQFRGTRNYSGEIRGIVAQDRVPGGEFVLKPVGATYAASPTYGAPVTYSSASSGSLAVPPQYGMPVATYASLPSVPAQYAVPATYATMPSGGLALPPPYGSSYAAFNN